jgi:hypothetical protein
VGEGELERGRPRQVELDVVERDRLAGEIRLQPLNKAVSAMAWGLTPGHGRTGQLVVHDTVVLEPELACPPTVGVVLEHVHG